MNGVTAKLDITSPLKINQFYLLTYKIMRDKVHPVKQLGWAFSNSTPSVRCLCRL